MRCADGREAARAEVARIKESAHTILRVRQARRMDSYETTEARVQQKERAYQKMDIMVATPGRMVDMLDRRATNLRHATYFVLELG